MNPIVSVVVPVYNCEKYLDRLFESLKSQTFSSYEVLFVNDGSTDGSRAKLEQYKNTDSRFRIIDRSNGGEGAARNTGLDHAIGQYVCFFDSDDFVERDMLETLIRSAEATSADIVLCAIDAYYEERNEFKPNRWAVVEDIVPANEVFCPRNIEKLFFAVVGYAANRVYRMSFVRQNQFRFQEIRTHGDLSFSYSALAAAEKVVYVDSAFYHHRIREGSLSSTTQDKFWECLFEALEHLRCELCRLDIWDIYEREFINYVMQMSIWKFGKVFGTTRYEMDRSLREKWFPHFKLTTYPEDFFFKTEYYVFLEETMAASYEQRAESHLSELLLRQFEQEKELAVLTARADAIENSKQYKRGHRVLHPFWLLIRHLRRR